MDDERMSIKDAAIALGVSRNSIFNFAERGLLRIIELPFGNPRHFVPKADVQKLLSEIKKSDDAKPKRNRSKKTNSS